MANISEKNINTVNKEISGATIIPESIHKLSTKIDKNEKITLKGIINQSAQTYLISQIPELSKRAVLWFTENEETQKIQRLLKYWFKNGEIIFLNEIKPVQLYKIINKEPLFIIASAEDIFIPLPSKKQFTKDIFKLEKGQNFFCYIA